MSIAGSVNAIQIVVLEPGGEVYGIEISHIKETLRIQPTRSVPDAPSHIDGITSVRGETLPVLDLRKRLGVAASASTQQSRLVVILNPYSILPARPALLGAGR